MFLIRSTGAATDELSFYGPLSSLLNAAGQPLKPRVRCVMNLKNQGAGMPDGGLFTPDQFQKRADEPLAGQVPGRGVIECKKVKEYAGRAVVLETYRLAADQKVFWAAAARPDALAEVQGDRFIDYLRRVMRHAAPLADLTTFGSWFLIGSQDNLAHLFFWLLTSEPNVRYFLPRDECSLAGAALRVNGSSPCWRN